MRIRIDYEFSIILQGKEVKDKIVKTFNNRQKAKLALDRLIIDAMNSVTNAMTKAQETMDKVQRKANEWAKNTKKNLHQKLMNMSKKVSMITFIYILIYNCLI